MYKTQAGIRQREVEQEGNSLDIQVTLIQVLKVNIHNYTC